VIQDVDARPWRLAIDTAAASPDDIDVVAATPLAHASYIVRARSVVVLVRSFAHAAAAHGTRDAGIDQR